MMKSRRFITFGVRAHRGSRVRDVRRVLVAAGVALFLATASSSTVLAQCVGGSPDGVVSGSEECDPNCGTPGSPAACPLYVNGDPDMGSCDNGSDCFFEFTCCKFNCQYVGTPGVPCEDGNDCTETDECNAIGTCVSGTNAAAGTACNDQSTTECDEPDTCDGAGTCDANHVAAGTTADTTCADGNDCTRNECDGAGGCQNPAKTAGASCGDQSTTECDQPDTCNGAGVCDPNHVAQGTTADTLCADPDDCTFNQCDGAGGCQNPAKPNGTECRPTAGACDVAEVCNAGVCPADALVVNGTECRAAIDPLCDIPESCDGVTPTCPADVTVADGTECRTAAGLCDSAETCSSGLCPADARQPEGTECRASSDVCDPAEFCDGSSADCPADVVAQDGTACDDGNTCTVAGTCVAKACTPVGPAVVITSRSTIFKRGLINTSVLVDNPQGTVRLFREVVMADGTVIQANRVRLFRGVTVYDVIANVLSQAPGSTVNGVWTSPFVLPGATPMCAVPPLEPCAGSDVVVDAGGTLSLTPGVYRNIRVKTDATLNLEEATYKICSIRASSGATINITPGASDPVLEITRFVRGRREVSLAPVGGAARPSIYVGEKVGFSRNATIVAHLYVPNGVTRFGRETVVDGTICTQRLTSFRDSVLDCTP